MVSDSISGKQSVDRRITGVRSSRASSDHFTVLSRERRQILFFLFLEVLTCSLLVAADGVAAADVAAVAC